MKSFLPPAAGVEIAKYGVYRTVDKKLFSKATLIE